MFDIERALNKVAGGAQQGLYHSVLHIPLPSLTFSHSAGPVQTRIEANRHVLEQLRKVVTKHLEKNGRRWVSMESLFSFMKVP